VANRPIFSSPEGAMTSYHFRYTNMFGGTIRSTSMQCASDAEAMARAVETMQDEYFTLEITEGERVVHCAQTARLCKTVS
jgi:hypothetical protein